jgi:hypothetical protein
MTKAAIYKKSLHQQIGINFKEEITEMLYSEPLEHTSVWS